MYWTYLWPRVLTDDPIARATACHQWSSTNVLRKSASTCRRHSGAPEKARHDCPHCVHEVVNISRARGLGNRTMRGKLTKRNTSVARCAAQGRSAQNLARHATKLTRVVCKAHTKNKHHHETQEKQRHKKIIIHIPSGSRARIDGIGRISAIVSCRTLSAAAKVPLQMRSNTTFHSLPLTLRHKKICFEMTKTPQDSHPSSLLRQRLY